jgi:lipopolysaccharide transport system permease protein
VSVVAETLGNVEASWECEPRPGEADVPAELPVTVIERRRGWGLLDLGEVWRHRELLYFLSWRDLKVRYKQTVLGVAWALLQPVAMMLVFSLFLSGVAGGADGAIPYPLFVFAGVLPWTFFANTITAAGNSVVANERLITKVYFPRLIVPFSTAGACLFDLAIALGLLGVLMVCYQTAPGWSVLAAPLILLLLIVTALGVGTLLSALIVAHRDFRYVLNFGVQLWMFATPTVYLAADVLGPQAKALLPLNPAYGLIHNFRQAFLGGALDWYSLAVSGGVGLALFAVGVIYFRRVERTFADVI